MSVPGKEKSRQRHDCTYTPNVLPESFASTLSGHPILHVGSTVLVPDLLLPGVPSPRSTSPDQPTDSGPSPTHSGPDLWGVLLDVGKDDTSSHTAGSVTPFRVESSG